MDKWEGRIAKIGAVVVIVGGMTLRLFGINAEVWSLVLLAAGFLFGSSTAQMRGWTTRAPAKTDEVKHA